MELTTVWFTLIAVLWIGYFCLEGFDFGVGMLLPVLARNETERRVMINTIGPVWDGNEVWVLVAGGATFAAFPEWYATLFSGFYLPLLLILRRPDRARPRLRVPPPSVRPTPGRAGGTAPSSVGSFVPALLWGVAFANIVARRADRRRQGVHRHGSSRCSTPTACSAGSSPCRSSSPTGRCSSRSRPTATSATGPATWRCGLGAVAAVLAVVFLVVDAADDGHRRLRGRLRGRRAVARRRPRRGDARPGGLGLRRAPSSPSASPSPACSWRCSPT